MIHRYPPVMTNMAIENCHRNSWFSHPKLWFSIVFCRFSRGYRSYFPWLCQKFQGTPPIDPWKNPHSWMTDVLLLSDNRNLSQHVAAVSSGFGTHSLRSALSSGSPRAKGIGRFVIGNDLGPRHEPNDAKCVSFRPSSVSSLSSVSSDSV